MATAISRVKLVALQAQAAALAADLAAIIADLDRELALAAKAPPAPRGRPGCKHGNTADTSTMGRRSRLCLDCGVEFEGGPGGEEDEA